MSEFLTIKYAITHIQYPNITNMYPNGYYKKILNKYINGKNYFVIKVCLVNSQNLINTNMFQFIDNNIYPYAVKFGSNNWITTFN